MVMVINCSNPAKTSLIVSHGLWCRALCKRINIYRINLSCALYRGYAAAKLRGFEATRARG